MFCGNLICMQIWYHSSTFFLLHFDFIRLDFYTRFFMTGDLQQLFLLIYIASMKIIFYVL